MTGIPVAIVAIVAVVAAVSGFAGGWFAQRMRTARLQGDAREVRDRLLREAEREASALHRNAEIEAKDLLLKSRETFNAETSKTRLEQVRRGELLDEREMGLSKKILLLDQKELRLENRDEELKGGLTALEGERKRVQETVVEQNLEARVHRRAHGRRRAAAAGGKHPRRSAHLRGSPGSRCPRRGGAARQAGGAAGAVAGGAALRCGARGRDVGIGGGSAERRHEGTHHRS